jgi:two-component system phosphate regulon sensor histidine kinase PhoR
MGMKRHEGYTRPVYQIKYSPVKPRIAIWLSLTAVILLILIQYYSISEMYKTKKEQFDDRYGRLVKTAMVNYMENLRDPVLDSLYRLADSYSRQMVIKRQQIFEEETEAFNREVLETFSQHIHAQTKPDDLVKQYLENAGAETDFKSGFYIKELYLLSFDEQIPVYVDTTPDFKIYSEAYQAYSYHTIANYFDVRYDFYIDFTHKSAIIYRDMAITLILAIVTILIVILVFYFTARNILLLKKLSDLKTDFINNMTHELKTPLSTIAVATSSLSKPEFLKQQEKVMEISKLIKKQNRHLTQLIDRILDISIWEKDQVRLDKKSVHIMEFVKEKLNSFRIEHQDDELTIHENYDLEKDYVRIDEVHMTTVFNNLLSNAVKYCSATPELHIDVSVKNMLSIKIRDNGIGIKKDDQKYIFDKFYRIGKGDFKTIKGLGLGLYYVKQIVNAHGGDIFVDSAPGKGTTFIINIPLNHEHLTG